LRFLGQKWLAIKAMAAPNNPAGHKRSSQPGRYDAASSVKIVSSSEFINRGGSTAVQSSPRGIRTEDLRRDGP
jgi:hypothetical protein